jgi:hypothetical protein
MWKVIDAPTFASAMPKSHRFFAFWSRPRSAKWDPEADQRDEDDESPPRSIEGRNIHVAVSR